MRTPATQKGVERYDVFEPSFAIQFAWIIPGEHEVWRMKARALVRDLAPELVDYIEGLKQPGATDGENNILKRHLAQAWQPKISFKRWLMRRRVRKAMPVLAHNLDRLTLEQLGTM